MRNILVCVYSHPEFYPPTLNAIRELSSIFDRITTISRNVFESDWNYPSNHQLIVVGKYQSIRESEKSNYFHKIQSFFSFTAKMYKIIKKEKPSWILINNEIPLFSLHICKLLGLKDFKVWYHNHDPMEIRKLSTSSIAYWAKKNEKKCYQWIDIFSLPANERKIYFDLEYFKGTYIYLPNLPSLKFYSQFKSPKSIESNEIRILYQGFINENKGCEEIIDILNKGISEYKLKLLLKGSIRHDYKKQLTESAVKNMVSNQVEFHGFGSYSEVPALANTCHIGIGIHHSRTDAVGTTLGTASNKIYEYAACGLPVIVYDNKHFRSHLEKYSWVFFTDLSHSNLLHILENIINNYAELSANAYQSFLTELNYETYFSSVESKLKVKS